MKTPTPRLHLGALMVGFVFSIAAWFKGEELVRNPFAGDPLFGSRWVFILSIVIESWLGLVWLTGIWNRGVALLTAACFLIFALVALRLWFQGDGSCRCFGAVAIAPKWMAAVDLALLLVTLRIRDGEIKINKLPSVCVRGIGILWITALFWLGWILAHKTMLPIQTDPDSLRLHFLPDERSRHAEILLINHSDKTITISTWQVSCSCIRPESNTTIIEPRRSVSLKLHLNLGLEVSRFRGFIRGLDRQKRLVFHIAVVGER